MLGMSFSSVHSLGKTMPAWLIPLALAFWLAPAAATTMVQSDQAFRDARPVRTVAGPGWNELTPAQKVSLSPLSAKWPSLSESQKRKWIAIAANFSSLPSAEQAKMHSRMTEWIALSPQQRSQARLNFAESKQLSSTQKTSTWDAYQALSTEEKEELARLAKPSPKGAATAVKPVSPQKLAKVTKDTGLKKDAKVNKVQTAQHDLDQNTLLPRSPADSAAAMKH